MSSPSSSVNEARTIVAARLRDIMLEAGLTGRELAERCRWHPAKSSRIINAKTPPSDADIRAWCSACEAPEHVNDLIAANRAADSMYVSWKKLHKDGVRRAQQEVVPLWERTRIFRVYCSTLIPGMLQTAAYARGVLTAITTFQQTPDDVEAAVAARTARSHVIREGNHRFLLLIEESVLRYRIGDAATMNEQLAYLLAVMALPRVSLGIVPLAASRPVWPLETFYMFDAYQVSVELLTAVVNIKTRAEISDYMRAFGQLSGMAVFGSQARALIAQAIDALD